MAFSDLFSFLSVLKQSINVLPKNGKLLAFLAISYMLLKSSLFLLVNCFNQLIKKDMQAAITQALTRDPSSHIEIAGLLEHMKEDYAFLLADVIAFTLALAILAFFLSLGTIIVSATSYTGEMMSYKDLFLVICKTWIRTLITNFYVSGLSLGYSFCVFFLLLPPLVMYPNSIAISVAVVIGLPAMILSLYLSVPWLLALVLSVVEEDCYGADALVKAARLVKGKRLEGFMLSLCFNLVGWIISAAYMMAVGYKGVIMHPTLHGLLIGIVSSLLQIMLMVVYTVFYFERKKHHGEEIGKLPGSVQYALLPTSLSG